MHFLKGATYHDKDVCYVANSGGRTNSFIVVNTTPEYDPFTRLVGDSNDVNMLTFGGIGLGKYSTLIYSVLAAFIGPVLCLDPKGEHATTTMQRPKNHVTLSGMEKPRSG